MMVLASKKIPISEYSPAQIKLTIAGSGKASKIHKLCNEAGLKLTPLGATFPYGKDLDDKNIRLAPTQVELDELEDAMELFCICVLLAEAN